MNNKPISEQMHGMMDYALGGMLVALPAVLGLTGSKRTIAQCAGTSVLLVNALSDHPAAVKRMIPMPTHRKLDWATVVTKLGLGLAVGAMKSRAAAAFYMGSLVVEVSNLLLTDWEDED